MNDEINDSICLHLSNLVLNFVTLAVHCELDGVTCSGKGHCGSGTRGCICDSNVNDEYCS